jgi:uncharacterized protein (TIGR00369 family)
MRSRWEALRTGDVTMPVNDTLGFVALGGGEDGVRFSWVVPEAYCNSAGGAQGGVLAAFADALLGAAAAVHLDEDHYPALAEMKISICRPAPAGTELTGVGRVLKRGRRVLFVEAEITDASGALIAKASGTEIPTRA